MISVIPKIDVTTIDVFHSRVELDFSQFIATF